MKKTLILLLAVVCTLTACNFKNTDGSPAQNTDIGSETAQKVDSAQAVLDFPGSYTQPDGWVKLEKYSSNNKIFYVEEGHENDETPDNISVNIGTNNYSADEHEKFRDAVVRQLTAQLDGENVNLTGDGTYTAQGDIVYIFTIEEATGVVTKQYYIVGEHQYCLIHVTNFSGSDNANKAAQAIADSFVWD